MMLGRAVPTMVWSRAARNRVRSRPQTVSTSRVRDAVTVQAPRTVTCLRAWWWNGHEIRGFSLSARVHTSMPGQSLRCNRPG